MASTAMAAAVPKIVSSVAVRGTCAAGRDKPRMIGNPVFAESSFHRSLDEGFRFALGMAAKRRVGVIVGGHLRISG